MDGDETVRPPFGRAGIAVVWFVFAVALISMFGDALDADAWDTEIPQSVREPQCARTTAAVVDDPTDRDAVERWWLLTCGELGHELPDNASR